ncbi:hypothetical protein SH601_02260 [Gracilibacillus sp. S3-1-1]|uniref:Uncharacterized protein n=1 Tax=Gracilibacillus pellucidus TaxID=3095368 RepID=A0ACC6M1H4_9BACI|nr:hypothetical protein [Gracilibacillus sp. S3-1-1]MDX8044797.1 hypothetical protein [Gracilibacillus sp. S3-1-1]
MKRIITSLTVVILMIFAVGVIYNADTDEKHAKYHTHVERIVAAEQKTVNPDLTHEEILHLTDMFMSLLVQEVDNHYKVVQYDTKEELLKAFEPYITREAIQPYIDYYYYEEDDGLYIVPTETPPWLDKNEPYEITKDDGKVTVKQTTENALQGKYTIEIVCEKIEDTWKIANISHK